MSFLWKENYCLRICFIPLHLCSALWSPDIWGLPLHLLERRKKRKKKKINLGFRWFCCLSACDSWSAVRGELTFIFFPFLSGFPHVSLSTFRVRLASSAPSVQHGSLLPWDPDNKGCFACWLLKERGDGEKQRGVFEMTDYSTTTTCSSTKMTARPLTLPVLHSHCPRFITTEQSCLINMYFLLLLEICCTVFLIFFFFSPR